MSAICVDSGFLIGLYDESDQNHLKAEQHFLTYFESSLNRLLIAWPVLYETISTRLMRRRDRIAALDRDWKTLLTRGQLVLLDDQEFRRDAIGECFTELRKPSGRFRGLSLADRVIRRILEEVNIRKDLFITFNAGDFRDLCARMRLPMIGND